MSLLRKSILPALIASALRQAVHDEAGDLFTREELKKLSDYTHAYLRHICLICRRAMVPHITRDHEPVTAAVVGKILAEERQLQ